MRVIAHSRARRLRLSLPVLLAAIVQLTGCVAAHRRAELEISPPPALEPSAVADSLVPAGDPTAHGPPASAAAQRRAMVLSSSKSEIRGFVEHYQTKGRVSYQQALDRGGRHLSGIARILEERGLPVSLSYLPLIESGFRMGAVSPAGATGPWQFTRATGRHVGLRIDEYVDERRDPVKSTHAAARYLNQLYSRFRDWNLALAAYNCGETAIASALDDNQTEDYWELREQGSLHQETRDFVPRFLAAALIAQSPEAYGFEAPDEDPLRYDVVQTAGSVSLRTVAELAGASLATISELNPALHGGVTPPHGYVVRVPEGTKHTVEMALARMHENAHGVAPASSGIARTHKLRKGQTLWGLARHYKIDLRSLMAVNHIRDPRRVAAGRMLHIPRGAATSNAESAQSYSAAHRYKVRQGDTLGAIAARHGVSVASLVKTNDIDDPNRVAVGRVLHIPARRQAEKGPPRDSVRVASQG